MLIPNIGPHKFLQYKSDDITKKSIIDTEIRPFSVTCYLEDTRAREKHIFLRIGEDDSFHVEMNNEQIDFFLNENEKGFINYLLGGCFRASYIEAYELVFPHLQSIITQWVFKYKRPINIYEVRIIDKKHNAAWGIPHSRPNTIPKIDVPIVNFQDSAISALFAIFREGMNSVSYSNKFLSYYKILESYPNNGPFKETNNFFENNNIKNVRGRPKVTKGLLKGAYTEKYHKNFLDKKFTRCRDKLRDYRDAVAHPFLTDGYINLDDIGTQSELSAYANLVERMALSILEEELRLWIEYSNDPLIISAALSYLSESIKLE